MNFKTLAARVMFPITACVIAFLSLYPKLPAPVLPWYFADKIYHMLAYMILSGLAMFFFNRLFNRPLKSAAISAGICIAWGGVIELMQPATGRHCDFLDFLVNTAGVLLVCSIILVISSARGRRQARRQA